MIAASAGNHAQGVAYHGSLLGIPVTVVMPKFAALIKVTNCRHLGANVILHGADLGESRVRAEEIARSEGLTFIHPFDNADVMAGQGTMALEILEQTPDVEAIVVPVGGGGLLAGIGTVMKALRPQVHVVGVEPEHAACLTAARAAGHPVPGAAVADAGGRPRRSVARQAAVRRAADKSSTRWSPSTRRTSRSRSCASSNWRRASSKAAAPRRSRHSSPASSTISRANRSCSRCAAATSTSRCWAAIIEIGLVADGRVSRFTVTISDRPGGLARLAELIASTGASIKEIVHDRAFSGPDLSAVRVICVVETTGHAHVKELHAALAAAGMQVVA